MALRDDVRYSIRALMRTPGFTAALVLSGAIGIGVNAVVFGFIGHLVDPAVMPDADVEGWQSRIATIQLLLVTVALFVFVIAAASVSGLMLSRAAARVHETSVRVALGAHGRTLVRPLLAEGLVVAVMSTVLGVLAAFWTVRGLPALFYAEDIEALPLVVDWPGVGMAAALGVSVVCAGALAPLLWTSRSRPAPDSRGTGPGLANTFGGWRSSLVIGQLTLCAVLLISAASVVDHLEAALRTDHAQRTGDSTAIMIEPPGRRFHPAQMLAYLDAARERFGDRAVGLIQALPGGRPAHTPFRIDDQSTAWEPVAATASTFDPNEWRQRRVRTVEGRLFGGQDDKGSCRAVVVSETFASTHLSGDALGRVIVSPEGLTAEVVGVMRQFDASGRAPQSGSRLWVYGPQEMREEGHQAVESWSVPADATPRRTEVLRTNVIDGTHLDLVGLALVAGRSFEPRDTQQACAVALVNEEAAAHLGVSNVLGLSVVDTDGRRAEIVGVVSEAAFRTLQPRAQPTIYFSYRQRVPSVAHFVTATAGPLPVLDDLPGGEVKMVTTLQDHLQKTAAPADRLVTTVVQVFAGLALMLSLVGVTGVTSDAVTRRTAEIALRVALGAPRWRIVGGVITYGARLAFLGASTGVVICLVGFRFVTPLPDGTRGPALWFWVAAILVLIAVVMAGSLLPARRALAVDPSRLLRE